jgi:carbohydrate-selective porin OprB
VKDKLSLPIVPVSFFGVMAYQSINPMNSEVVAGLASQCATSSIQTDEQLFELNYGAQIAPWLLLRPAIQYAVQPGAYASRPDSLIFTLHAQVTL